MTKNTMKVKEFAAELGVPHTEVIRAMRDMGIPAKSAASPIQDEELPRLRDHFAAGKAEQPAEQREVQPGVILRRRTRKKSEDPAETIGTDAKPVSEDNVAAAQDTAVSAVADEDTVPNKNAQPKTTKNESRNSRKKTNARPEAQQAKVISRPGSQPPMPEVAPLAVEPVVVEDVAVATKTQDNVQPAPQNTTTVVATPADVTAATIEITKSEANDQPNVAEKNVTQDVSATASTTQEIGAQEEKTQDATTVKIVQSTASPDTAMTNESEAATKKPAQESGSQDLIQEPASKEVTEATPKESVAKDSASKEAKGQGTTTQDAQPQAQPQAERQVRTNKARPAASATPEGSSAPSLLPPVSETRANASDNNERKTTPRPQETSTQHVRVISRPDPAQVRRNAEANAGRDTRENRDSRDGNRPSRPGGPRPAGGGQRDGVRPDGFRPATPRSGSNMPNMPDFGHTTSDGDSGREGQSKKKRNKNQNRRGGEFLQNDNGGRRRIEDDSDMPRMRGRRRNKNRDDRKQPQSTQPLKATKRKIRVEEAIRVADMAHQMGLKSGEIIKVLFKLGVMATINEALDLDTAAIVAAEFGYEVEKVGFTEEDYLTPAETDAPESLKRRPPVITIMGHVDHGKTSLLDAIRKTNVTSGEAGGITQHIGAYHVKTKNGEIVFLDTPGHEAFTAMRARGAQVTDLVVLVVAADDGVMEQTREAVNHSRAAGVPIMVAVNKIDKEGANPDRVLRELAEIGLVPESWGGDTVVSMVSAKSREGLDDLLEMLALQAEILDLKANPDKSARGHIVEAKLDKGRGPVATVLIQQGTLHQGDNFVCGVFSGRVRAMFNDQGRKVKEAGPSIPVEVQGFDGVPEAGEEFVCLTDEKLTRRIAETRAIKQRERELAKESRVTLETFLSRKKNDQEALVLNLVVKADVQGSLEAIIEALNKQSTEKVRINVIHGGAGAITESDILLASASDAIVIGFNVRPTAKVKDVADRENVDIRYYDIIYKLIDEIKSAMAGLLAPVSREVYLGQADVRQVFTVPKAGAVAGCHVSDGKILRAAGIRLLRDGVVVHTGKIASLRRFKDDVKEVMKGYECGIGIENYNDIKISDVIEAFDTVTEAATL